jgi:hypothetical protein
VYHLAEQLPNCSDLHEARRQLSELPRCDYLHCPFFVIHPCLPQRRKAKVWEDVKNLMRSLACADLADFTGTLHRIEQEGGVEDASE